MSRRIQVVVVLTVVAVLTLIALHPWVGGASAFLRHHQGTHLMAPAVALLAGVATPVAASSPAVVISSTERHSSPLLDLICIRLC